MFGKAREPQSDQPNPSRGEGDDAQRSHGQARPEDASGADAGFGGWSDPPAGELDALRADLMRVTHERDEAMTQWKRALADFQNFQRRAASNEQEARRQGVTSVLGGILPVLDHFDLALTQATPDDASRRILDGVKVIRQELIKALENHGVVLIDPKPGELFDPNRHQAVFQQPSDRVESGHVSAVFQVGYTLGDRVIRSAKVAVAP